MDNEVSFQKVQYQFSAYIRAPNNASIPAGIEKRRIDLYRELMLNNVESFLSKCFPVIKGLMSEAAWLLMVEDFYSVHRCQTPYFSGIPEEFLNYLQNERKSGDDWPFLSELAHYEWVELALSLAEDEEDATGRGSLGNDALEHSYRTSELAWALVYRFPVHRISQAFKPLSAPEQPTFLVVYRNPEEQIKFMEINAVTHRFVQLIDANPNLTARQSLADLAREAGSPDARQFIEYGLEILRNLWVRGIVHRNRA